MRRGRVRNEEQQLIVCASVGVLHLLYLIGMRADRVLRGLVAHDARR